MVGKAGWRLDRVRGLGLAECVDALSTADLAGHLRELTGGRGAEVTIDATGRPEVWEQAIDAVGRGGTVVFFGGCAPGTAVRVDTRRAHYEELTLVGAFHHTPGMIRLAVELLESKAIAPEALVTHRMGLPRVKEALDLMGRGETMKVLVDPWSDDDDHPSQAPAPVGPDRDDRRGADRAGHGPAGAGP
jgi:L-iditol 2-dehydrogenase